MDSRERVRRALNHREPDRVPIDFWCSRRTRARLEAAKGRGFEQILDDWDVDLRYVAGPRYTGPPLAEQPDGSWIDLWGVRRIPVDLGTETYDEVTSFPLSHAESVEEIEAYPAWPSPDWFDYSGLQEQCAVVRSRGRTACFMGDRLNRIAQLKPAMYLRGVQQILVDMAVQPEIARALFRRIGQFYLEYEQRALQAARGKLDILVTGDDFGMQQGPLLSPKMWTECLADGFAQFVGLAHRYGVTVMHHTCGDVWPIIPLMTRSGMDILQSIQPEAAEMDPVRLKSAYGDRLCFHGGVSIQRTLPFGTRRDIDNEVCRLVKTLAPQGGYILCTAHNIQADTPLENIEALIAAYHKRGGMA